MNSESQSLVSMKSMPKPRTSKRELEEVKATIAELKNSNATKAPVDETPDLDPEAQAAINKWAKSQGFMTKAEFEESNLASSAKSQLTADVAELSSWSESKGYPKFDHEAVNEWAKENNVAITSMAALKGAYLSQNQDAILTAAIKAGVTNATETPKATVEKPGAATGKAPSAPATGPKRLQDRIGEVLSSLNVSS